MNPEKLRSFCEIECELQEEHLVYKKTGQVVKAVVVVHVFGNLADMEQIMEIAGKYVFRILLLGLILRTPLISVRMAIQRREMKCSKICYSKISISWSMMKTTVIIKDE